MDNTRQIELFFLSKIKKNSQYLSLNASLHPIRTPGQFCPLLTLQMGPYPNHHCRAFFYHLSVCCAPRKFFRTHFEDLVVLVCSPRAQFSNSPSKFHHEKLDISMLPLQMPIISSTVSTVLTYQN